MKTSTECPSCGGRLTLWHGFRSPTPLRHRCAHCQTELKVTMPGLVPVFWGVMAAAVVIGGVIGALTATGHATVVSLILAILFCLWFVGEIVTGIVLYTFAEFSILQPLREIENKKG